MEAAGQSNQFSAANVEAAVVNFYVNGGANPETHTWLTSAQMSTSAWSFAWELLTPQKKPEVQFFGASTIALKVGRFFHEVPNDQYEALRQKIVDLLTGYKGPHIVRTRLCVAMADLLIHSIPDRWSGPVSDVINLLGQGSATGHAPTILFELLTVIPEEYSTLALPAQKRSHIRAELAGSLRHVLPLIQQVLGGQQGTNKVDSENSMQAIKCLQAWVQFGVPMEEMSPLIDRVLAAVREEELFDCSLDALSSIVSHPDTHKYVNLLKHLLERILTLEPLLSQLVNEGSYEMASPLVCLFVTFGESHSRMMIDWATGDTSGQGVAGSQQGKELSVRLLRIILAISSVPAQFPIEETISEMPFGFWYIFQDDMIACEPPQFQQCGQIFGPIYQMLVDSLLRKAMYNLKENEWTPDQRESFRCYRTDIADTIMYCFNILRENLLALLLKHVEEATTLNLQDPARNWPYLEASLYVWSAVAESLAEEEDECPILTQFLAKLPTLPYNNNMKVISSALDCIGGFAEWLAMHPNLLPHVAPIVTSALQNPDLALCATMALKDMCRDCADGMKPYAQEVIDACDAALKSNQLKTGECVRLTYSVGKMLSLMPPQQILPRLEPILSPYLAELQSIAGQEATPQLKPRVDFILKLLTTLFQSLEFQPNKGEGEQEMTEAQKQEFQKQNPVFVLFPQIYPLLKQVAEKWIRDADIIETMCNLLKQCVTTLMDGIRPFTNDMVMLLVQCYEAIPHSCMLDLARNFFVLFAKEEAMQPLMQGFFKHLVAKTMNEMASSSNPSDFSDLIASFFGIMSQVIKKAPALLATEGVDLVRLFTAACGCLGMPENGPVKNSAQFLSHFIGISREMNQLSAIINHHGEALFLTTIRCIGGESARSFTDYYVDILFALNKKYFDNLRQWLSSMVNMDNFPTPNVSKEQKHQFATFVLKERANKRKLLEVTREFSLACCGLAGTEYAMQMGQVMAVWDRIGMKQEGKAEA